MKTIIALTKSKFWRTSFAEKARVKKTLFFYFVYLLFTKSFCCHDNKKARTSVKKWFSVGLKKVSRTWHNEMIVNFLVSCHAGCLTIKAFLLRVLTMPVKHIHFQPEKNSLVHDRIITTWGSVGGAATTRLNTVYKHTQDKKVDTRVPTEIRLQM